MNSNAVNSSILIPLDGSSFSERAVAYGIYIGKRINFPIIGLYADRPLEGSPTEEIIIRTFHENCRRSGMSPEVQKIADLSTETILSATEDIEGRLILLPRQESADSFGAIDPAESALCRLTGPVMVIPPKFLEIESMGVLYDGSAEAENALELAVLLSHKAAWPLTILVPSQDNQQIGVLNRQLDEYFEMHDDFPVDWDTVALTELKDETVLQFIRDGSIELLVLAAAAQPPIRLLRESPIPLILTC